MVKDFFRYFETDYAQRYKLKGFLAEIGLGKSAVQEENERRKAQVDKENAEFYAQRRQELQKINAQAQQRRNALPEIKTPKQQRIHDSVVEEIKHNAEKYGVEQQDIQDLITLTEKIINLLKGIINRKSIKLEVRKNSLITNINNLIHRKLTGYTEHNSRLYFDIFNKYLTIFRNIETQIISSNIDIFELKNAIKSFTEEINTLPEIDTQDRRHSSFIPHPTYFPPVTEGQRRSSSYHQQLPQLYNKYYSLFYGK